MKLSSLLICSGVLVAVSATAIIDPSLKQRFRRNSGGTENVMVTFTQGIQSVIQRINQMSFPSPQAKRSALTQAQESFTNSVQAPLKTLMSTMGAKYESFWISNTAVVQNANSGLVNMISKIPGVAKVEKEPVLNLNPAVYGVPEVSGTGRYGRQTSNQSNLEWGIRKIRADQVWSSGNKGKGIVVAGIDTGVRYTHRALVNNWRREYGWLNPGCTSIFCRSTPSDGNGHGTHTIGTIVGTGGIGVAPEAQWIACMGCTSLGCSASSLNTCGQWVQCPTDYRGRNRNCDMAPDIVSNSWGGGQGQDWYDPIIESWQAAGIVPVFSMGNSGPECGTANSPGDRPGVISVGSTEQDDTISSFSSLGPAVDGTMQPLISAPGGKVRSAWHTGDTAYNTISGTSMACPHVSGVVALMLNKNEGLEYDDITTIITSTASESLNTTTAPAECNEVSTSQFPNNVFGYGQIDALDAVSAAGELN